MCNTLEKQFGMRWLQWFIAITVTQSHFMFYMSRPLPNIMALPLVLLALDGWLRGDGKTFILCSGAAIIIYRAELALFLGILLLYDLYYERISIKRLLQIGAPGGIAFLLLSVVVDSIFWRRPLWPEGEVLWYNTILNKSSDWGTSPFLWYFYSALPRGLAASILLVPVGCVVDQRVRKLVVLSLTFIFFYSFLPHKELRFIIYVFPFMNVAAAVACHRIWENRTKSPLYHFLSMGIAGHLAVNAVFTLFLLSVSRTNYPGGTAISHLHRLARNEQFVNVHISNLAAQTGVSRFAQLNSSWIYDKTEHLKTTDMGIYKFTHLIEEGKSKYASNLKILAATHDIIDTIEAFHQISFNYFTIPPVKIKMKPVLFILKRRYDFREVLAMKGRELRESVEVDEKSPASGETKVSSRESNKFEGNQTLKNEENDIQKNYDDGGQSEDDEGVIERIFDESSDMFAGKLASGEEAEARRNEKENLEETENKKRNKLTKFQSNNEELMKENVEESHRNEEDAFEKKTRRTRKVKTRVEAEIENFQEDGEFGAVNYIETPKNKIIRKAKSRAEEKEIESLVDLEGEHKLQVKNRKYRKVRDEAEEHESPEIEGETSKSDEDLVNDSFADKSNKKKRNKKNRSFAEDLAQHSAVEEENAPHDDFVPIDTYKKGKIKKVRSRTGEESDRSKRFKRSVERIADTVLETEEETIEPIENENNRFRVKQNIKKIIQKYRRKKINEEEPQTFEMEQNKRDPVMIYEEISKIEQQIIDIIENNPNILNKEFVESRLRETIKHELVNAMDPTAVGMLRPEIHPSDKTSGDRVGEDLEKVTKQQFVNKFKKATERLDSIISIIDEIVDTIEITDDN